jgi:DNA modification methylase
LVADAIKDCTARGDEVLDPFLGSGTTVIAAARTGRICYGMDLDPLYVDTAVRRCQRFTGLTAVHEDTGQAFEQREEANHVSE